jgi:hypothetical protein
MKHALTTNRAPGSFPAVSLIGPFAGLTSFEGARRRPRGTSSSSSMRRLRPMLAVGAQSCIAWRQRARPTLISTKHFNSTPSLSLIQTIIRMPRTRRPPPLILGSGRETAHRPRRCCYWTGYRCRNAGRLRRRQPVTRTVYPDCE